MVSVIRVPCSTIEIYTNYGRIRTKIFVFAHKLFLFYTSYCRDAGGGVPYGVDVERAFSLCAKTQNASCYLYESVLKYKANKQRQITPSRDRRTGEAAVMQECA